MTVELVAYTQPLKNMTAEDLMVYTARVSSPQNQDNIETGPKLLKYCMKKGHWSVFEQADMTLEITTSRAISAQILRHKSFSFQEFSQRYAEATSIEKYVPRLQDTKNRQSSLQLDDKETLEWFDYAQDTVAELSMRFYKEAIHLGVAKECARFLLPMATTTTFYMKGSCRSWIHWFKVRLEKGTQKEHRDVALEAWKQFEKVFPVTAEAMRLVFAEEGISVE
jgi:thymidylate synthase (FAD)